MNRLYFLLVLLFVTTVVDGNETDVVTEDSEVEVLNITTNADDDYYGDGDFQSPGSCIGATCALEKDAFCHGVFHYGKDKSKMYVSKFKL